MEHLSALYEELLAAYTLPGLVLLLLILILFSIQLRYWAGIYAPIHSFRNSTRRSSDSPTPAVSVVVVVRDQLAWVEQTLPLLLEQQYPDFEIVVVDLSSQADVSEALALAAVRYPHLHVTRLIQQEQRFPITSKMALNVGIKAAAHPNLLLTTTEAEPRSARWLALMARGFVNGDVVIGYCGIAPKRGIVNALMRCGRLFTSIRYLAAAIRGRAYRGIGHNIGYTAELYFAAKGFNHLDMEVGDDDLFIQQIVPEGHTSVVMNPNASMSQWVYASAGDWFRRLVERRTTRSFYTGAARRYIGWEVWSRTLFFAGAAAAIALLPFEIRIGVGALALLRLILVEFQVWRICRRLGEKPLGWAYVLYDLFSPLYALALQIALLIRPRRSEWK